MENSSDDACKANQSDQTNCIEVERKRQIIREKFIRNFSQETSGEWTTEFSGSDLTVYQDDADNRSEDSDNRKDGKSS